jgi:hypothetical protein
VKRVVISQPMFLPWIGIFEQIRTADIFVHYDDVQFPQGRSFSSRVQVKAEGGTRWLTVPVKRDGKQLIRNVKIDTSRNWKESHLGVLRQCYRKAPFGDMALELVDSIYALESDSLFEFCTFGIEKVAAFLGLRCEFALSSQYGFTSSSSQKLLDIVMAAKGDVYVTGHGAKNYLDHELFESHEVDIEYMQYVLNEYHQMHSDFTPYVSMIDVIAHVGERAPEFVIGQSINWKEFVSD